MKKFFTCLFILSLCFACNKSAKNNPEPAAAKQDSLTITPKDGTNPATETMENDDPTDSIYSVAEVNALIKGLETELYAVENVHLYDSESAKAASRQTMQEELLEAKGKYCCVEHNGEHCAKAKDLETLNAKHGCKNFKPQTYK